jgi:hypothetical protein
MGHIVEVKSRPNAESVAEYDKYLKYNAPQRAISDNLRQKEIECTCCTQQAPAEVAALIKVQDDTPTFQKFGMEGVGTAGKQGVTIWICADCFTNGVRPKYVYFGNIKWNKMGRKVKGRAEDKGKHPW